MKNRGIQVVCVTSKDAADKSANEYKQSINEVLTQVQQEAFNAGLACIDTFSKTLFPKFSAEALKQAEGETNDIDSIGNQAVDALDEARTHLAKLIKGTTAYNKLNNAILTSAKAMDNIGESLNNATTEAPTNDAAKLGLASPSSKPTNYNSTVSVNGQFASRSVVPTAPASDAENPNKCCFM